MSKLKTILMLGLVMLFVTSPVWAGKPYKNFWLEVQDEFEVPRTDFVSITVYTIDTTSAATIYTSETGGSKTNPILLAATSDGRTSWYGNASTFDVLVTFSDQTVLFPDFSVYDHRIMALDVAKTINETFTVVTADTITVDNVTSTLTTAGTSYRGNVTCSLTTSSWALPFWGTATFTTPTQVAVGSGAGGVFEVNMTSAFQGALSGVTCGAFIGAYSNATGGRKPNAGLWIETIAGTNADFAATGASSDMPVIALVTSGAGTKSSLAFEFGYEGAGKTVTTTSGGMFYQATIQMKANGTLIYMPTSTVEGTYTTAYLIQSSLATDATSSADGAVIIAGGVGIAKKLFVGLTLDVSGASALDGAITAGSSLTLAGVLSVDDTTQATGTTDGSIHTDGGLGVAKKSYFGDDMTLSAGKDIRLGDSGALFLGAADDVRIHWDGAKVNFMPLTDDVGRIDFGTGGRQMDVRFYTGAGTGYWDWDNSASKFIATSAHTLYQDGCHLYQGTSNDIDMYWTGSGGWRIKYANHDTLNVEIGANSKNIDWKWWMGASGYVLFDVGNLEANLSGMNLRIAGLSNRIYFGTVASGASIWANTVDGRMDISAPDGVYVNNHFRMVSNYNLYLGNVDTSYFDTGTPNHMKGYGTQITFTSTLVNATAIMLDAGTGGGGVAVRGHLRLWNTAGDGATDGQIWYDPVSNKFQGRANGSTVDLH